MRALRLKSANMDMSTTTQNARLQRVALAVIILLLAGYGTWATSRIISLQQRLDRVEASFGTLARYTYDFGAAVTPVPLKRDRKTYVPFDPDALLGLMRKDPLLGPAIEEPRARSVPIRTSYTTHNQVVRPVQ